MQRWILTLFLPLFLSRPTSAEGPISLNTDFLGIRRVNVTGQARSGMWLGVSLVSPKGDKRFDKLYPLSLGRFWKRISFDREFAGGSYELALWRQRVLAADCSVESCAYCPVYGHHFEGRAAYRAGRLHSLLGPPPAVRLQRLAPPMKGPLVNLVLR